MNEALFGRKVKSIFDNITGSMAAASDLKRDNANINGDTPMGAMLQYGANAVKEYYLDTMIDPETATLHRDGWIHIHDLDFYGWTTTCTQIELKKLFKGGFNTGHGYLREPKSIGSYAALAAIAIQSNQNDQHGGQSIVDFDHAMADGVMLTYEKYLEEGKRLKDELGGRDDGWAERYAMDKTRRDTYQAMEGFIHNMNTLQARAGSQVPFSSINYGTDTTWAGRLAIEQVLLATEAGLGHGETPIFPIQIFRVKEGVNYNPGDPNYDLFKLAMRVSAKRLFPNFSFLDAPFNKQYYQEGHPETEVGYMGAVTGEDVITIRVPRGAHPTIVTLPFKEAYNRFHDIAGVEILDRGEFVPILQWHCYPDGGDWYDVIFSNGATRRMTSDHPLPTQRGRVFCENLVVGDTVPIAGKNPEGRSVSVKHIRFIGSTGQKRYDVTTASDRFDVSGINTHNCRTRVMGNVNGPEIAPGRGNLSFTSINLPRLALESQGDQAMFFRYLDEMLSGVMKQLLARYVVQSKRVVRNFPFLMGEGVWMDSEDLGPDDAVGEVLKHGTLSIGFIGLAETLKCLTGKHHGESVDSQKLGLEIVGHIRDFCDRMSKEISMNVTCLATPAEGLSGRFIRIDRERYGIIEGVTDRDYYTNSFHVPVYFPIAAARKIEIEAPYHALTNAGHISYVEMDGNASANLEAFEKVIRYMKEQGVGYGSINHPIDRDPVCGYNGIIGDCCPSCGRMERYTQTERIRRNRIERKDDLL